MTIHGKMKVNTSSSERGQGTVEDVHKPASRWISEGVLLAIVPIIGYGLALTYEIGYLHHFDVPEDLVTVDVSRILLASSAALGILIILYYWCNITYMLFARASLNDPVVRCILRTLPAVIVLGILWIAYGSRWRYLHWAILWLAAILFLEFIFPLLMQYRTKGYRAKLTAQEEHERKIRTLGEMTLARTMARHGPRPFILVGFLLLMFVAAFSAGHAYALKKRVYPIQPSRDNYAIVRIYGGTIISVKYDADSHELLGEILVETISSDNPLTVLHKDIGPLSRTDPQTRSQRE